VCLPYFYPVPCFHGALRSRPAVQGGPRWSQNATTSTALEVATITARRLGPNCPDSGCSFFHNYLTFNSLLWVQTLKSGKWGTAGFSRSLLPPAILPTAPNQSLTTNHCDDDYFRENFRSLSM